MDLSLAAYLDQSADAISATVAHVPEASMTCAVDMCVTALKNGKTILVCGNGGSASDAMHIAGEFVGRFLKNRKAFRCICLSDNPAVLTAWANDFDFATVYSRQVEAYGEAGGVLIAITTSGNSPNVLNAAQKAKEMGLGVIGLTGEGGGKLAAHCDVLLDAPSNQTPLVQQVHVCLYHYLCAVVETRMAG
ncbi:MAG: SIS domain-containing protein [Alphaproteobacteria bacterium]|nr:SIS domain-containing protein [Alphaproteobacteria bacterium]